MPKNNLFESEVEGFSALRVLAVAGFLCVACSVCTSAAADVLLRSDFSNTYWYTEWQNNIDQKKLTGQPPRTIRIPADTTTAGFVPIDGPALQVTILKGTREGTGLSFYPRTVLGKDPNELYLRYNLRFGSDWLQAQGGKLPGFGGTYDVSGWGGKTSDGTNGWSARGKFGDPCANGKISIGSYVYYAEMSGKYGAGFDWTNGCTNGLNRNQWYLIDYYVKVNTPGESNGILRGWIDGALAMERTGLRFDDSGEYQIERVWMNIFHGGSELAPQDMHVFFDNVVVSQEPIGRNSIDPAPPAVPNSPSGIRVE